ncbi:thioredoxin-like protein [Pelagophyceae sp. CCMP2097]|nr:thioredoxin-like protein [Pelagophyceae sp. CCMP2097]
MQELGSEADFDAVVAANAATLVVVDFATTWCGPCKVMEPKMNALSDEFKGALFYKVVGDSSADASALMKREGVRAVPSFHFWKNGEKVDVVNGANIEAVTNNVKKFL